MLQSGRYSGFRWTATGNRRSFDSPIRGFISGLLAFAAVAYLVSASQATAAGGEPVCRTVSKDYVDFLPEQVLRISEFPPDFNWDTGIDRHRISAIHKVRDGWLVTEFGGEFGGGVYHIDSTGHMIQILEKEPVQGLVETRDGLIAVAGLSHLLGTRGDLYLVYEETDDRWSISHLAKLPAAPEKFFVDTVGQLQVVVRNPKKRGRFLECAADFGH